jgi:Holliday junction resolvase-like predicted endonuclease
MLNDFMNNAKGLAKNPLGLIALFISLIYGFACLVMSISAEKLETSEKIPLIWFLIIFPIIVLAVFVYLVIYHHKKLYSPSDFREDRSFLETIDKSRKIINEFQESEQEPNEKITSSDRKETESPKTKITVLKKPESIEFNDFKNKYLQIEDLVIEKIENIYCTTIKRNVRIKGLPRAEFDGVITKDNEVIFIEIKYVKSMTMSSHTIESLKSMTSQLIDYTKKSFIERKVTFLIYIVFEVERLEFLFNQINNLENDLKNNELKVLIFKDHYLSLKKITTANSKS